MQNAQGLHLDVAAAQQIQTIQPQQPPAPVHPSVVTPQGVTIPPQSGPTQTNTQPIQQTEASIATGTGSGGTVVNHAQQPTEVQNIIEETNTGARTDR